jgi:hypothetical protein
MEGSSISRLQCSFEIDLDSGVVMLYDRSSIQTTQVSGENATPFESGRLRRVVVQEKLNTIIGTGVGCNLVRSNYDGIKVLHKRPRRSRTTGVKRRTPAALEQSLLPLTPTGIRQLVSNSEVAD